MDDHKIEKKFGGTLTHWQLHTIFEKEEDMKVALEKYPGMVTDKAYIFTATVVEDPTGRWEPGFSMRSSMVLRVDPEAGIIETANTIYRVVHEGDSYLAGDCGRMAMSVYF